MLDENFVISTESIAIGQVVLVRDARAAEIWIQEFFHNYVEAIVVSADGQYPLDPGLNAAAFKKLRENAKLPVVVFNFECLKKVSVKSDRLLVMDDLVVADFLTGSETQDASLDLDHDRLGVILQSFFSQWAKIERIANPTFHYRHSNSFSPSRFNWMMKVILGNEA